MKGKTLLTATLLAAIGATTSHAVPADDNGIHLENLDTTVAPGSDFYRFACGGWMDSHPLTDEFASYGTMIVMREKNAARLHEVIQEMASRKQLSGSLEQKIGDLYRMAMDSTRRNREKLSPLHEDLNRIAALRTKNDVTHYVAQAARKGIPAYFSVYLDADAHNSRMNLLQIGQGGLSLGEREYYLDTDSATLKIREAFKHYIERLFMLCGDNADDAHKEQEHVLRIETALAKAAYSGVQRRNPEANYHKTSFAQLQQDYSGIDWKRFLGEMGFANVGDVNVVQPKALEAATRILASESVEAHRAYLKFHLLDAAADYLNDELRSAHFDFYGRILSGSREDRPQWKRAVSTVESVLGEAVGRIYVNKYFPASSKERMLRLVRNLQASLKERIEAQDWMSDATKQKAVEKLATFRIKIGYPDKWRDFSKLTIDPELSFWENLTRAAAFELDYAIATQMNRPVDPDKWYMNPQTVNAYYNPATNEICFPAGILEPPFFDAQADDASNYGAIGVVIGHEMTHGFDDQGRLYDKDGDLKNWWTEADAENFKQRADKMVQFFDRIEVLPGLRANGSLTLGENLADHGGLNIAFQAFRHATRNAPLPVKEGYTPEQRFFIAYAGIWAMNVREEYIRMRTKNDVHSLGRWRVNGALPHIEHWYKAFDIKPGDPLFIPEQERVTIW